jgi:hypothetical protein
MLGAAFYSLTSPPWVGFFCPRDGCTAAHSAHHKEVVQLTTEYESMTTSFIFDSISASQLHLSPPVSGTAARPLLPTIWVGFFCPSSFCTAAPKVFCTAAHSPHHKEVVHLTTEYESKSTFSIFSSISASQLHLSPQVSGTAALADLPTI